MNQPHPIDWKHRQRLRIRPLSGADLAALDWLLDRPDASLCTLEQPADAIVWRRLLEAEPALQWAIERGQQLVGAALATTSGAAPAFAPHPWTAFDAAAGTPAERAEGAAGEHLFGQGLIWRDLLDDEDARQALTLCRKTLVQRRGFGSFHAVAEAVGYRRWRDTLSAEAYVQQVHAGSLTDPVLSMWIAQGFSIWGHTQRHGTLRVVVRWNNRTR